MTSLLRYLKKKKRWKRFQHNICNIIIAIFSNIFYRVTLQPSVNTAYATCRYVILTIMIYPDKLQLNDANCTWSGHLDYDHYSSPLIYINTFLMLIKWLHATYQLWVQVAGQPMHPGRVLDDPVEEISQVQELAAGVSVSTDWHGAHAGTQVQAQKCHKESSYSNKGEGWKGEREKWEENERNIIASLLRIKTGVKERIKLWTFRSVCVFSSQKNKEEK